MTTYSRVFTLRALLPYTTISMTKEKQTTLFVGVDVHKDTHTVAALSPFGDLLHEMTITNRKKDFKELVQTIERVGKKEGLSPRFGLEDCTNYGTHLATYLCEEGYAVVQVSPVLVSDRRVNATHPEKSDSLDARGVAKVMTDESVDTLPTYTITETGKKARQLREVGVERDLLIQEKTRVKNQLHQLLHRIWSDYTEQFSNPFSQKALRHWLRFRPSCDPYLTDHMKRKIRRLQSLTKEVAVLDNTLQEILGDTNLLGIPGCGVVLAATILGEIGDINTFRSSGGLAKYAGCAPREHSSGKTIRHRKTRGGNRRLNSALYHLALAQIARYGSEEAKTYYMKKKAAGKSNQQALACLKRQLVNVIWMLLKHDIRYYRSE